MRIPISDLSRPKAAAKALARLLPTAKLATVHEVLAHELGYRDWHELTVTSTANAPIMAAGGILSIVFGLSDALDLDPGDVQYALNKARLLPAMPLSIDAHLNLCASTWRRYFGPPGQGKPGTIVKVKAHRLDRPAYLLQSGRPTILLFDTGLGSCADSEVVTPRTPLPDHVPSRLWLPYGYWTLTDGSEVMFSRDYVPLWRVTPEAIERLDPWLWINGIVAERHFGGPKPVLWHSGDARRAALQHLAQQRVNALPRLVSIMPYLIGSSFERMGPAIARLCTARGQSTPVPPFARLNPRLELV
ncbi:MAG: hypothetical protein AB7L90_21410 [Hyphomicrobiaceae bacterium]